MAGGVRQDERHEDCRRAGRPWSARVAQGEKHKTLSTAAGEEGSAAGGKGGAAESDSSQLQVEQPSVTNASLMRRDASHTRGLGEAARVTGPHGSASATGLASPHLAVVVLVLAVPPSRRRDVQPARRAPCSFCRRLGHALCGTCSSPG